MEAFVELGATSIDHITNKPIFDRSYDAVTRRTSKQRSDDDNNNNNRQSDNASRAPSATSRRSRPAGGDDSRSAPPVAAATAPSVASSRRRHRNQLPSPERDLDRRSAAPSTAPPPRRYYDDAETASEITTQRTCKQYEREIDDPVAAPEFVLPRSQLRNSQYRRDSAMTSRYGDDYTQAPYRSRSSNPPKTRYYDDEDSDYDERTGRRYSRGNGRGYDDRDDYETVREETERYRGPVSAGPLVAVNRPSWDQSRRESFRSGYDAGAVVPQSGVGRRDADDRRTMVTRRSQSRGRDRSYSRSRSGSRSRSRSGSRGNIKEKLGEHFDTSKRGLGVGLAGAVIGGLAGRQFGHKHKERDIILGAIVGGIGANLAENKYHEWKEKKEDRVERDVDRYEQRWDGRSRSNVR